MKKENFILYIFQIRISITFSYIGFIIFDYLFFSHIKVDLTSTSVKYL